MHSSPGADEYYQTLETFEIFLDVLESTDPFPVFTLSYATYSSRMKLGIARVSSKHPMLWFCQNKRIIKGRNSQKTCLKMLEMVTEQTPRLYCKNLKYLVFSHFLMYANRSARVYPIVLYKMFRNRFWGIYLFRYLRRDPSPKLSHFLVMTGILQQLVLHTMNILGSP